MEFITIKSLSCNNENIDLKIKQLDVNQYKLYTSNNVKIDTNLKLIIDKTYSTSSNNISVIHCNNKEINDPQEIKKIYDNGIATTMLKETKEAPIVKFITKNDEEVILEEEPILTTECSADEEKKRLLSTIEKHLKNFVENSS